MEFRKEHAALRRDPTPRIVAIELGETGTVKVYRREKDGGTTCDIEQFHPFVWLDSDVADLDIDAEKLAGDLRYGWLKSVNSWKELIALRNGLKKAGPQFFRLERSGAALPHRRPAARFSNNCRSKNCAVCSSKCFRRPARAISRKRRRVTSRASRFRIIPAGKN